MSYPTVSILFVMQDYTKGVQNSSGVLLAVPGGFGGGGGGGGTTHIYVAAFIMCIQD